MKLSEKAMLVNLKISVWTARKFDPKVTQEIERSHNTRGDIGRFNKALVSLKSVKKYQVIAGEIRTFHYANTLPWGDEGVLFSRSKITWIILPKCANTRQPLRGQ
jgi:hypothetical protein